MAQRTDKTGKILADIIKVVGTTHQSAPSSQMKQPASKVKPVVSYHTPDWAPTEVIPPRPNGPSQLNKFEGEPSRSTKLPGGHGASKLTSNPNSSIQSSSILFKEDRNNKTVIQDQLTFKIKPNLAMIGTAEREYNYMKPTFVSQQRKNISKAQLDKPKPLGASDGKLNFSSGKWNNLLTPRFTSSAVNAHFVKVDALKSAIEGKLFMLTPSLKITATSKKLSKASNVKRNSTRPVTSANTGVVRVVSAGVGLKHKPIEPINTIRTLLPVVSREKCPIPSTTTSRTRQSTYRGPVKITSAISQGGTESESPSLRSLHLSESSLQDCQISELLSTTSSSSMEVAIGKQKLQDIERMPLRESNSDSVLKKKKTLVRKSESTRTSVPRNMNPSRIHKKVRFAQNIVKVGEHKRVAPKPPQSTPFEDLMSSFRGFNLPLPKIADTVLDIQDRHATEMASTAKQNSSLFDKPAVELTKDVNQVSPNGKDKEQAPVRGFRTQTPVYPSMKIDTRARAPSSPANITDTAGSTYILLHESESILKRKIMNLDSAGKLAKGRIMASTSKTPKKVRFANDVEVKLDEVTSKPSIPFENLLQSCKKYNLPIPSIAYTVLEDAAETAMAPDLRHTSVPLPSSTSSASSSLNAKENAKKTKFRTKDKELTSYAPAAHAPTRSGVVNFPSDSKHDDSMSTPMQMETKEKNNAIDDQPIYFPQQVANKKQPPPHPNMQSETANGMKTNVVTEATKGKPSTTTSNTINPKKSGTGTDKTSSAVTGSGHGKPNDHGQ